MARITFTAEEQHRAILEGVEDENGVESTAAAVRKCIERAAELQQRDEAMQKREEDLQQRIVELEQENERLRNQLAATNRRVDQHQELVEYVEEERSWRSAGLSKRMKWWLFGKENK